jgi:hypothetical protein
LHYISLLINDIVKHRLKCLWGKNAVAYFALHKSSLINDIVRHRLKCFQGTNALAYFALHKSSV